VDAAHKGTLHSISYDGSYRIFRTQWAICLIIWEYAQILQLKSSKVWALIFRSSCTDICALIFSLSKSAAVGLRHPDDNIDHRRAPNLGVFFSTLG